MDQLCHPTYANQALLKVGRMADNGPMPVTLPTETTMRKMRGGWGRCRYARGAFRRFRYTYADSSCYTGSAL
ncbi:hypothetical protein OOU_Y34scaffold01019g3 [Pyricularia oryzae Y34]|uniref:Uncharacterized protein n=1 Tax=Pyricularia oryzae (strain Y34) TaxID=1143189 RepID=A0AA97NMF3_PYRO3|nr:hypothetical protein OOU_Y34scaffold01019g3 [Pyricularia oryzae Y34]